MVEGLRITIKGSEVIAALSRKITELEQLVSKHQSDLGLPQVDRSPANALVPRQSIESTIQSHQAELETLRFLRDHIVKTEDYLMDRDELRQAHLVPPPP